MIKILVVEDDDQIREEVRDWLQFEGYDVFVADNGEQGLALAQEQEPELILSDITMPQRSGYDLLLEVRANPALGHIPFVFLTAHSARHDLRRGMDMGADDYLTKPFTHAELLRVVRARLKQEARQKERFQAQMDKLEAAFSEELERRLFKSRLVAMFTHDFRNPLSTILSSSNLMRALEGRLTAERRTKYLDRIDGAVHLLLQMLDEMLLVGELESGGMTCEPEEVDVQQLLSDIIEEFRLIDGNAHELALETDIHHPITIDSKLLRQVIVNLISNALKYSPEGSSIQVHFSADDQLMTLRVQDSGIGIPAADLPNLSTPFFRSDNARDVKGTGLGLSIVAQALELCGGEMVVDSELNRGTTVTVTLPPP